MKQRISGRSGRTASDAKPEGANGTSATAPATAPDENGLPRGIWSGIPMPWDADERLIRDALRRNVDRCVQAGSHGIYVAGTTGEFHAMDERQFADVVETFAEAMARHPQIGMQIGCGAFSLAQVCRRIAVSLANGCNVVQLPLPGWLTLTDDEIMDFFGGVLDRFPDISICVYDNGASGRRIGSELWPRLMMAYPAIRGAKFTACAPGLPATLRAIRPGFRYYAVENDVVDMGDSGIDGVASWIIYSFPAIITALWTAVDGGDSKAAEAGRTVLERLDAIKSAMRPKGYRGGVIDRLVGLASGFLEPCYARVLAPWRSIDPADVVLVRERVVAEFGADALRGGEWVAG